MRKRTSSGCYSGKFDMEMGSNIDLSLLRRPLTPFTGFQEAKNAFDKGTVEVRHLLLYECGLIYECNVCRNMFRSLANFISHKRVFCCTSTREYSGSHNSTNGTDGINSVKQQSREYMLSKHEAELRQKIAESKEAAMGRQIISERSTGNVVESAEKQVPTVRTETTNQKSKPSKAAERKDDGNAKPTEQAVNESKEFPTSAYVFQCPSCSLTFLKSSSVIRHLAVAHNIPIRRIRMMRDSILKCRAEPAADNAEKPTSVKKSRELKRLQLSESSLSGGDEKKDVDKEPTASKCFFCHKSFERRAVLVTHMQNCPIKTEVLQQHDQAAATPDGKRIKLENNTNELPKEAAIAADVDCQIVEHKQETYESDTHSTSLEVEEVKRAFANLEHQSFGTGLQTVSLDKLDISAEESTNTSLVAENELPEAEINEMNVTKDEEKPAEISSDISSTTTNNSAVLSSIKKRRMRITNAQFCRCKICNKQFNALSNLRRHISMFHYRARKFGCALCDYCAFRRYDIINHLNFVHKLDTDNDTTSKDLVRVNDVKYTKDDMNDDIVLCSSEERDPTDETTMEEKSHSEPTEHSETLKPEKRQRQRRHNKSLSAVTDTIRDDDNGIEVKLTRQKLKRSQSTTDGTHPTKNTQKRPKRIRTKPVNKDFVYDLSTLSKKEGAQSENLSKEGDTYQLRALKRRNTLNAHTEYTPPVPAFELLKAKHCDAIKGASRRACLILVNQGLAASSTLPEIPAERPQMRPRLTSTQRSDSQAGPIIETMVLEAARLKSLPLCDDSYLEKITKESVGSFKIRPCLEQQHSALDSLLQKVDSSKQLNGVARHTSNQVSIQPVGIKDEHTSFAFLSSSLLESGCNNNIALSTLPPYLITPEQTIPKTLIAPTKPQKRLPSLDRLTETINTLENLYSA